VKHTGFGLHVVSTSPSIPPGIATVMLQVPSGTTSVARVPKSKRLAPRRQCGKMRKKNGSEV
jgi:hypothetical protein